MRASACDTVDVLSDEAAIAAGSRLNPAAGVMLSAIWVASERQLVSIVHHLAVDGVSWRILLEDLNIAWTQHRSGQQVELPATGTSFARWAELLVEHARRPEVTEHAYVWRRIAATPPALPAVQPEVDTYASAGNLSVTLDTETTQMLLGEVPTAFHAGIHDILLIAFALAWAEFLDNGGPLIGIDVEGHGRHDELGPDVDLSRTVGWFTTKFPVTLAVGGLTWEQVVAGGAALGARDQGRQRAAPGRAGSGDLRSAPLSEPRCRHGRRRPVDRIQLSGAGRRGNRECPAMGGQSATTDWRVSASPRGCQCRWRTPLNSTPAPWTPRPARSCTANWKWAPSALDDEQVGRLSRLWFEALTGICAHVRHGGGGLTPSDLAVARLSQQQIDELERLYADS